MKLKRLKSKQRNIRFVFCPFPITLDMRKEWGQSDDNIQHGPRGAFLKLKANGDISHLVQPNDDLSAPVGWQKAEEIGYFNKNPIWVEDEVLPSGTTKKLVTLDGPITYTATELSMVCYNEVGGAPNPDDGWIQTVAEIQKHYFTE